MHADGPLVRRYKQLASGGVIGMAFGYFGEASTSANIHKLLGEVAATLAHNSQAPAGALRR
jgi:hypothetical protein